MSSAPGANSPMHIVGKAQTIALNGREWTFDPLPIIDFLAEVENRVRSVRLEAYLRAARSAGIDVERQDSMTDRILFGPLQEYEHKVRVPVLGADGRPERNRDGIKTTTESRIATAIDAWARSPAGMNYTIWLAMRGHHPDLLETALPFSAAERAQLFTHICVASGFRAGEEDDLTGIPPQSGPPAVGTTTASDSGTSPPAMTGA